VNGKRVCCLRIASDRLFYFKRWGGAVFERKNNIGKRRFETKRTIKEKEKANVC